MKTLINSKLHFVLGSTVIIALAFTSCMSSLHTLNDWDKNGNGALDQTEFNQTLKDAGYFNYWDADSNGQISRDEWDQGGVDSFNTRYDADDDEAWNTWDLDGNGSLSEKEFNNGVFATIDDFRASADDTYNNRTHANNNLIEPDEFDDWYEDDLF